MKLLLDKIKEAYKNTLPFVVYNKPNDTDVFGVFQKDKLLHNVASNYNQAGFIFAPFNTSEKTIFFPLEKSTFVKGTFTKQQLGFKEDVQVNVTSKETHIKLVQKAIDAINDHEFKKVVVSRKEMVAFNGAEVEAVYTKLLQLYSNAFVYVWFHPEVGLWFGATPETLIKVDNSSFTTMSLAGTQVFKKNKKVIWSAKEIEEQHIVTAYILNKLSNFSTNLKQLQTETIQAGSLVHLRTEITGDLAKDKLFDLVELLHPTPAVCGFPKEKAKQFILENEQYNRSYYTGYLGELNMGSNKNSHLFVNLRCMEIKNNLAEIYVGGGITKESNPEREWEETIAKSQIMLKVL